MNPPLFRSNPSALTSAANLGTLLFALPFAGFAQSSYTINDTMADAFIANGPSGNLAGLNFGSAGTLAIAPASSAKGEFDSVIEFNTSSAFNNFNTTYGAGNWQVTGVSLMLASNFGVQGQQPNNNIFNTINAGSFGMDWLANNSWVEGTGGGNGSAPVNNSITFNTKSTLFSDGSDSLGVYIYTPPGNNVYLSYNLPLDANLTSEALVGGDVSLYFYAADNQVSYLFNSKEFASNHPELTLTVSPVPEPASLAVVSGGLALLSLAPGGLLKTRRQKR